MTPADLWRNNLPMRSGQIAALPWMAVFSRRTIQRRLAECERLTSMGVPLYSPRTVALMMFSAAHVASEWGWSREDATTDAA